MTLTTRPPSFPPTSVRPSDRSAHHKPPKPAFNTRSALNDILLLLLELRYCRVGQVECIHDDLWRGKSDPLANRNIGEMIRLEDFDKDNVVCASILDVVGHCFGDVSAIACVVVECASVTLGGLESKSA